MKKHKSILIIALILLIIIIINIPTEKPKTIKICKNSSNFKLYWEEKTLDEDIKYWYYENNNSIKVRFQTDNNLANIYFLEIYNKTSGIDLHYYKSSNKYILDMFNTTEVYFNPFEIDPCINNNDKQNISSNFNKNIFSIPLNYTVREDYRINASLNKTKRLIRSKRKLN